jgi:hypothetical protein
MPHKEPAKMSNRELKRIYASSLRLRKNIDRAQIREMIRRGFFSKGIWLDELDVLESVAKEIVNERDGEGRTMLEFDPELLMNAKEIVDIRAQVPLKERHPGGAATRKSRRSKLP